MRVIVQGNWAPYVGTDYCEALGKAKPFMKAKTFKTARIVEIA